MTVRKPPRITGPHFAICYLPNGVRFTGVDRQVAIEFLYDAWDGRLKDMEVDFRRVMTLDPMDIPGATLTVEVLWD